MAKYRKLLISAVLLAMAAATAALVFYWRSAQAPATARLLPEGDFLLYANLKPLHALNLKPVKLEGDYQDFVTQTGIQAEHDIDEIAMSRRDTPDGADVESSEIVTGRFDPERLKNYLQKVSSSTESYRDHTIYLISHEGHLVRVSLLDGRSVAITNMQPPEPMHGIIDRGFKPTRGPLLLAEHYRDVPLASLGWLINRNPDSWNLPGGLSFSAPANSTAVVSLRYSALPIRENGSLLFQADILTQSQQEAKQLVDSTSGQLALARSISQWLKPRGPDKDVKAIFDSIQIEQKEKAAVFTATIPVSVVPKLFSEAEIGAPGSPLRPGVQATPIPKKR